MIRSVTLPDETFVPALGQGTWRMGEDARLRKQETAALRAGVELGMTLIDTAEMYGDGATESLLGDALTGLRDQVFLVNKVYPQNAGRGRLEQACQASLRRLKTDRLDLYLLHRRGGVPLAETVEGPEALVSTGKIQRWGVSNLDRDDMDELQAVGGERCATDQILYNVTQRGAEFDLMPRLAQRRIPVMATARSARVACRLPLRSRPLENGSKRRRSRWRSPGCCAIPPSSPSPRPPTRLTSEIT